MRPRPGDSQPTFRSVETSAGETSTRLDPLLPREAGLRSIIGFSRALLAASVMTAMQLRDARADLRRFSTTPVVAYARRAGTLTLREAHLLAMRILDVAEYRLRAERAEEARLLIRPNQDEPASP
jgi:hypothetical protein